MKYLIILLFTFPFLLSAQTRVYPVLDTTKVEVLKTNDSIPSFRIRRTIINSDSTETLMQPIIARGEGELINVMKNQVHEISMAYSQNVIEILGGLPFRAMVNRYIQTSMNAPDTSLFIALNKEFPLETGKYFVINNALGGTTTWELSYNEKDQYFYMTTNLKDKQVIYITSPLHFRVGVEFDFFKVGDTWISLQGFIIKKIE